MSKHFITGAARSVTNSVERLIELRKNHPEWNDKPSEKALARERLRARRVVSPLPSFERCKRPNRLAARGVSTSGARPKKRGLNGPPLIIACYRWLKPASDIRRALRHFGQTRPDPCAAWRTSHSEA